MSSVISQLFYLTQLVQPTDMNTMYNDIGQKINAYFPITPSIMNGLKYTQTGTSNVISVQTGSVRWKDQINSLSPDPQFTWSIIDSITNQSITCPASVPQKYIVAKVTKTALDDTFISISGQILTTAYTLAEIAAFPTPNEYAPLWTITNNAGVYTIGTDSNCATNYGKVIEGSFLPVNTTSIPNNANLNNYTTTGIYYQGSNGGASSGTNYPAPLAGSLEVFNLGAMIYQRYVVYASDTSKDNSYDVMYLRCYYTEWSPWKKQANLGDNQTFAGLISFTQSPIAPTVSIGAKTTQLATMEALWNQTIGIGIGIQSAALQTFNAASDLWSSTYNGGGIYATGSALPSAGNWFVIRIASGNQSSNGVLLANNTNTTYTGYLTGSSITWTQLANLAQLQDGTFNANLQNLIVSNYIKNGNQPTNSSPGLLLNSSLYYPGIVEPVLYAGKANSSFEIGVAGTGVTQQTITFDPVGARPMINAAGLPYDSAKGIATLADITANGGGIVASGGSNGAMWVKFANGLILQTVAIQITIPGNDGSYFSVALPISITDRTTYNIQSSFGGGNIVNGTLLADIPGTTTISGSVYNGNATPATQILEFFVWSY